MLVFVVPLKSPTVTKDWGHVSRLAIRTLRSLCAQTSPEFHVILACNRAPEGIFQHPNLTVIEEDFPEPDATHHSRMMDKFRKLQRASVEARRHMPGHLMFVDADDCVSRRLAAWCAEHPDATGWYFKRAYVYDDGTRFAFARDDFDLLCGSSAIVRCQPEDLPQSMEEPRTDYFFLTYSHPILRDSMRERGTPLEPLPFPGAVYITGTGENHSGMWYGKLKSRRLLLQKIFTARYLTPGFRREFGL